DVDSNLAEWLWGELEPYAKPLLAPHPDDLITDDLMIDPDEPVDWLMDFCKREGLRYQEFPEWPKGRPATVGNFARWLSDG
ncbi:hypothetical protein NL487_29140, partial [Klebsiella pneumoniae]|nr:hypothetical protein [Klebsiella pneumoniae]